MSDPANPFVNKVSFDLLSQHSAISLLQLDYDVSFYCDELYVELGVFFPPTIQRSAVKRKAEFLAGRLAALYHIQHCFDACDGYVAIGQDRSPVWPKGIIGSLSHTRHEAVCLLGRQSDIALLGVDIEDRMSSQTIDDIKNMVVSGREEQLCSASFFALNDVIAIVFSAKESLFKSLYPKVLAYFDFFSAEMISINIHEQSLVLVLTKSLCDEYCEGDRFVCYFHLQDSHVLTFIYANK